MTRTSSDIPLVSAAPGVSRTVRVIRYGDPDARPKAYIHGALHADEAPGLLVCHHLIEQLDAADARGEIRGQIVVVPYANPIGLGQFINGDHLGRFDLASGLNFNRHWPDLSEPVAVSIEGKLTDDPEANKRLVRQTVRELLDERIPSREVDSLHLTLAREAFDADLVLDLHCDDEGLMHLFLEPELWPELSDLSAELGCRAVFLQSPSGGGTFSEACAAPWVNLASRFPDKPIPLGCMAATVELRGFIDVSDDVAAKDATAMINVLRRRGFLSGQAEADLPEPACEATSFSACDIVRTPNFGVLVYHVELGAHVERGQPIADIIDPAGQGSGARSTIHAGTDGLVVTRRLRRLVAPNQVIAKIAGAEPLQHRQGYLLED